jgi:hypothetical protein
VRFSVGSAAGIHYGEHMKIRFRNVTVEVEDERARRRLAFAIERVRAHVTSYLRIASDDVGAASQRLREVCDRTADRLDNTLNTVIDRIDPADTAEGPRLKAV